MLFNKAYYFLKPALPWRVRIAARRIWAAKRRAAKREVWPIDESAGIKPAGWPGWPNGHQFALVLTHDVEGVKGLSRVETLMALERRLGFTSSFNFSPREYDVPDELIQKCDQSGCEVGVHGLEHDGKLYSSKASFELKAIQINRFIKRWNAKGFRSPLMQHRLGWLHRLNAEYDSSTFDTDPFEPEADGVRTIFPFWVAGQNGAGFVELPYTLAQDFALFVVLRENNINVWKEKLDWIAQRGGMAMLITHPDYMCFAGQRIERDEAPASFYEEFLTYVREKYSGRYWAALPRDVNRFYRASVPPDSRNTRKKVCILTYSRYENGGRVRRYAESLADRGDMVDVVALKSSQSEEAHALKGVHVYGIQHRANNETGKWSYAWQLFRFLYGSFVTVTRRHREIKYDLIHVHNIPDFLVFAALYPKWTGAKIILDIHDVVPELFEEKFNSRPDSRYIKILKIVERLSATFSDHVIISNHLWQKRVIERSVPREKCSVMINHVDPTVFYRRDRTRADGKLILLFPGSLQSHHGLDVAIRALARLKDKLPNCELHLYGGGGGRDAQDALQKLASELGLEGRVRFFRPVPLDQIPQLMANADIGVVPKRADTFGDEAYNTKTMEFMSQGIPVIASRTSVDSYYFSDETVCFFKSGDDQAMAEALLKAIGDRELRESLSRNGLAYAALNSWNSKKGEYLSLVDSLCAERFESANSAEADLSVPLEPRVSRRPTVAHMIAEDLPVPHSDKDPV